MLNHYKSNIDISKQGSIVRANSKYIVSINRYLIIIYIFEKNSIKKVYENKFKFKGEMLKMSKIYDNIFLIVSQGVINVFEISEEMNYKPENKIRIETNDRIEFTKFSEYNEKIIGAVSDYNLIRLWNIDSNFNFLTIKINCDYVEDLIFNKNKNMIMIQANHDDNTFSIYIYDFLYDLKVKKVIKRKNKDFIFEISEKNFEKIILVNQSNIEFMDLTKNNEIYDTIKLNLENQIDYVCFYKDIKKIFLFSKKSCSVIDIEKKTSIYSSTAEDLIYIFNDFYSIDNNKLNINILWLSYIETFSFELPKDYNIIVPKTKSDNLFNQKFKKIYSKNYLEFINRNIDIKDIKKKSYLEIEEIENALHKNYSLNLETKKENVKKAIKDYSSNDTIYNNYIFLIKLLIQDNTNKDLLKLYLQFLKDNDKFLKNEYNIIENFEIEYDKYKVVFTTEEIKQFFGLDKESEKDEFLNFLNQIKDENDLNQMIQKCEKIYLGVFNQGIDYNNKELFWFKNKALVVFSILKIDSDKYKLMQFCINKIFEKKLFDNSIILNDYKYIALLIFLIVIPLPKNDCENNLKLIESLIQTEEKSSTLNENQVLNRKKEIKIFNYEKTYDTFNKFIIIDKIKKFLKKIYCSNVIKEAFQILYPSYIPFPFKTEEDAENYINKYINFVVFYSTETNAVTDKFSLDTYIFLK